MTNLLRANTTLIVVHCSATPVTLDIGAAEIDHMHRHRSPPFERIGYHAVIRRSARIEYARHFDEVGAHARGVNYTSVGICLVGGLTVAGATENNFTEGQFASLAALLRVLLRSYPEAKVVGHRDVSPDLNGDGMITPDEWSKVCPCFDVADWWQHRMPYA